MTEQPTRSPDRYADATGWAHRRAAATLTIAEADAQRAMRDRCVARLRAIAAGVRGLVAGEFGMSADIARSNADSIELAAEQLARLQPAAEPDGLAKRGA